jgi:DNA-binding CsgD family transcriptional regulator
MSSTVPPHLASEPSAGLLAPDALAVLTAIDSIRSAADAAECLERLFLTTSALGATAALYMVLIPEPEDAWSSVTLLASDHCGVEPLFDAGGVADHPWVRFARSHSTAVTDGSLRPESTSDTAALGVARAYGFTAHLVIPTTAGAERGRVELLCLGRSHPAGFDGEDQRLIRLLAHVLAAELHDWFKRHLRSGLEQSAGLRPEDIQLLALEWQGLGTKDIALRTGLSLAAVDSRFQRLNQRLNCSNRKASARRAAEYGLLEDAHLPARPAQPVPRG